MHFLKWDCTQALRYRNEPWEQQVKNSVCIPVIPHCSQWAVCTGATSTGAYPTHRTESQIMQSLGSSSNWFTCPKIILGTVFWRSNYYWTPNPLQSTSCNLQHWKLSRRWCWSKYYRNLKPGDVWVWKHWGEVRRRAMRMVCAGGQQDLSTHLPAAPTRTGRHRAVSKR